MSSFTDHRAIYNFLKLENHLKNSTMIILKLEIKEFKNNSTNKSLTILYWIAYTCNFKWEMVLNKKYINNNLNDLLMSKISES